jgi:hypothetical protein
MTIKMISLGLTCAMAFAVGACNSTAGKGAADVNNTLSAPEHVNTSTEPQGKPASSPAPSSSK